ncbi:uncharacterized protein LOC116296910 [Actinia tenebrosa]|uniref:Uncharacterized protein LOC116296910 n=1 Tax=Actinia tenebrosa TaxID=6105 RepID=A0A6P8I859_ACTTE|nr:uncharacterized protein LOC116296910 [Actinia tenebrosa]
MRCMQHMRTIWETEQKEPMKSLPIPTMPWQIVSQDIFTLNQQNYLVTVCHFSGWLEVDKLKGIMSSTVIQKTKDHFTCFGIPKICHTNNDSQLASEEYDDFATFGFKHTTSSPYHPQGNGKAEAAVKVAKSMLKKLEDFHSALLNHRNNLSTHVFPPDTDNSVHK